MSPGAEILPEVLERHFRERADTVAIRFLARGEAVTAEATYRELGARVASLAAGLAGEGLAGRPVVLALPPGLDLIVALLACLRAGAIAVPVPFPAVGEAARRLDLILGELGGGVILADADTALDPRGLPRLDPARLVRDAALPPLPAADAPAVIQYSSGSTRAPQGIAISQRNIVANQAMIGEAFAMRPQDVGVNWLPPHHDMGLFGAILHPLFVGATTVLMPPMAFIQKPLRWLQAISDHRGTVAGAPNFGYDLCVRRIAADQAAALDLGSLQVAFCGAEPIRGASLSRFADHFAPAGFSAAALLPCYGLAEATLLATSVRRGSGPVMVVRPGDERRHVSCGHAPAGCDVTIRDSESGARLPEGALGEICVAGDHVAIGAWDGVRGQVVPLPGVREEAGHRRFHTGDIGALTSEGLIVLDRIRDIVIVHGHNVYAADAEDAALAAAGALVPAAAAFAVTGDAGEAMVIVCELARSARAGADLDALARAVSEAVGRACGVVPAVHFVPYGALPRTPSGKIRRQEARRTFGAGRLSTKAVQEGAWAGS